MKTRATMPRIAKQWSRKKRVSKQKPLSEKERSFRRLEDTRNALLEFANAGLCSIGMFEAPIESKEDELKALRISLDLWESPKMVEKFVARGMDRVFRNADMQLASTWIHVIQGPMVCMQADGDKALFLCEGAVFEVISFGRLWNDMVPYMPDMIYVTLLPFDDVITSGGLLVHHFCHMEGPGVQRIQREFEAAKQRGVIRGGADFVREAERIRRLREEEGLDPTSYFIFDDIVNQVNEMVWDYGFPYENTAKMRPWEADWVVGARAMW